MMTADEVIESYVRDVAHYLPRKKRNDVAFELRALLHDELAAKAEAQRRTPDKAMAMELLAGFGRPAEAAARYEPRNPLIDPADNHNFLIWAGAGAIVFQLLNREDPRAYLQWIGLVFLYFALAAWARRRRRNARLEWRPRRDSLPETGGRAPAILAGVATLVFPFAMYLAPSQWWETVTFGKLPARGLLLSIAFLQSWQRAVTLTGLGMIVVIYAAVAVQNGWRDWSRRASIAANLLVGVMLLIHALPLSFRIFVSEYANDLAKPWFGFAGGITILPALYSAYREWARVSPAPALHGARVLCVLSMLMMAGAAVPADAQSTYVKPDAPGRLIEVRGRRLHMLCKGTAAGPTVIFEAGLSQYTANSTYGIAQDAIAPFARVCTYDRAGLGWSDPAPQNWTYDGMAADLHALLAATGERAPVVIVAHSMGGLVARAYARTYPDDVAGLILLDATSDEDFTELAAASAATVPKLDAAISASRPGLPVVGMPAGTSPEVVMAFTPEILKGVKVEFEALDRLPAEMKRPGGFGDLGDLPLIVVRRGKTEKPPSESDQRHQRVQENLSKLSKNSTLIVAENSGHTIALDEPGVVADAVRQMLKTLTKAGAGR